MNLCVGDTSKAAAPWFVELSDAIESPDLYPERRAVTPEDRNLRQLLFGTKPHVYRIIYEVDRRKSVVNVAHIRRGARAPWSALDDV